MIDYIILMLLIISVVIGVSILLHNLRFRHLVRKRYAVTLKTGSEFAGLMTERHRDYYTFEHCSTVPQDASQQSQPIIGRVHVERANVDYLQELPNDPV